MCEDAHLALATEAMESPEMLSPCEMCWRAQ
jgi:hypothetical protein